MPGDIERATFRPGLRFANVGLQQGRLLLAADFNEQSVIHHHFLRNFIVDLVGSAWRAGEGFAITVAKASKLSLNIGMGHYYVDGIMCENSAPGCTYEDQPFRPAPEDLALPADTVDAVLYLDCWERHVSCLQYPLLRDPALGGVDTSTRIQIAWQVRLMTQSMAAEAMDDILVALGGRQKALDETGKKTVGQTIDDVTKARDGFADKVDCARATALIDMLDEARPRLAADAKNDVQDPDPCAISADSEYRGRENQLYRVEIHRPGLTGTATFKWSRENGSVAFRVIDVATDKDVTRVTLESLGHDRRTGLCADRWVELSDDDVELRWEARPLLKMTGIDVHRRTITLSGAVGGVDLDRNAILRRWDHEADEKADGAMIVRESRDDAGWIDLERGVRIRFSPGGVYRKGDYWLIPARVASGDVEWPTDGGTPLAIEPHGIQHHRAVLATAVKKDGNWTGEPCGCKRDPLCAS